VVTVATGKITPAPLTRTLSAVAVEVADVWPAVRRAGTYDPRLGLNIGEHPAHPYLVAMAGHTSADLNAPYGYDSIADVVARFLDNASGWRGLAAARIKGELRAALAHNAIGTHAPVDYPAGPARAATRRRNGSRY
jgi:hypothetical protein